MSARFGWLGSIVAALLAGIAACGGSTLDASDEEGGEAGPDASLDQNSVSTDAPLDQLPAVPDAGGARPLRSDPGEVAIIDTGESGMESSLIVLDALQNGGGAPLRRFHGLGWWGPVSISDDSVHDEIVVGSDPNVVASDIFAQRRIETFPRTATGETVAPLRSFAVPGAFISVVVDATHEELLALTGDFYVFPRLADGDAAPARVLHAGSGSFTLVASDAVHDEVALGLAETTRYSLNFYARTAADGAAPLRAISGASTGLLSPNSIVIDPVHDEVFVSNAGGAIQVYPRTASGDVAPIRTITGTLANLDPIGLALDVTHGELFVCNGGQAPRVSVYDRLATGAATPLRKVMASVQTGWNPRGIAILK